MPETFTQVTTVPVKSKMRRNRPSVWLPAHCAAQVFSCPVVLGGWSHKTMHWATSPHTCCRCRKSAFAPSRSTTHVSELSSTSVQSKSQTASTCSCIAAEHYGRQLHTG